MSLDSNLVSN